MLVFILGTLLYVLSSFVVILKMKRELVSLLLLSFACLVNVDVPWLFFTVPGVDLQLVIVLFPDHTHLTYITITDKPMCNRNEEPHSNHETPGKQTKQNNQLSSPSRWLQNYRMDTKQLIAKHRITEKSKWVWSGNTTIITYTIDLRNL